MAGSYNHIVDDRERFIGIEYIENLGDAHEALEECYGMIWYLASKVDSLNSLDDIVKEAERNYKVGLQISPGRVDK